MVVNREDDAFARLLKPIATVATITRRPVRVPES